MVGSALQRRCELGSQKVTVPEGELASCRCRRRRRAISLGVVLSQFSDNTPPDANTIPHRTLKPTPVVCQPAPLEGGLTSGPTTETAAIEFASAEARQQNICNQPNSSTAKATFTTWDTAQKMVRVRGGFIPSQVPDDHTKVWLMEVRGFFLPPLDPFGSVDRVDPTPARPRAGTMFIMRVPKPIAFCCAVAVAPDNP